MSIRAPMAQGVEMKGDFSMDYNRRSLELCEQHRGKLQIKAMLPVKSRDDLSCAYTPGVAAPCRKIHENPEDVYKYTIKGHLIAVVTDGTAVLGLGDIGPLAAMPVMEGKCLLFKEFGGLDAVPICLATKEVDEIVETVKRLEPSFGGINLEDISAPRCFEIERRLKEEMNIPVFHDDQHGTAIVVSAGLLNALRLVKKKMEDVEVVINGAGSAGISICRLLLEQGVGNVVLVDKQGAVSADELWLNSAQREMAKITNKKNERGSLQDVIRGKDVFIGVSAPNVLTAEMVSTMAQDSIVFAMANPIPEIMPEEAKRGGARVIATGRSDFPNQINNVLVFPGIFKGAMMVQASDITEEMKIAAAQSIASLVTPDELQDDYIIPSVFDARVADVVANDVATVAERLGIARAPRT